MSTVILQGPCGDFHIPSEPQRTREVCEFLARQVWAGEYAHPEIQPPEVMLDIGAGWGAFAVWAFAWWPGLRALTCYEPHREAYELLLANTEGAASRIEYVEAAITADPAALYSCHEDWGAGRTHEQQSGVPVRIIHPRDLPECDMMKCDNEGSEIEVLTHYQHWPGVRSLLMEFHSPDNRVRLMQIASELGLRLLKEPPDSASYGVTLWTR